MRDIHEMLELWGAWAASEKSGIDFSPVAAGFKGLLPDTSKSRPQCCDDQGIMIDGCIARLKKYKSDEFNIIIEHYVFGSSLRTIAKRRKISDGTIRKKLQNALGFVEGLISILS